MVASSVTNEDQKYVQQHQEVISSAFAEAMAALVERGEKMEQLNDKVEALGAEAEDFFHAARRLREQAERNSRWF